VAGRGKKAKEGGRDPITNAVIPDERPGKTTQIHQRSSTLDPLNQRDNEKKVGIRVYKLGGGREETSTDQCFVIQGDHHRPRKRNRTDRASAKKNDEVRNHGAEVFITLENEGKKGST